MNLRGSHRVLRVHAPKRSIRGSKFSKFLRLSDSESVQVSDSETVTTQTRVRDSESESAESLAAPVLEGYYWY
jgi:hypothetical protein